MEESLDLKKLTGWLEGIKETNVYVNVPRFKVEDSFSLKEKLQAMGLVDLFAAEKASLPGSPLPLHPRHPSYTQNTSTKSLEFWIKSCIKFLPTLITSAVCQCCRMGFI